MANPWVGTSVLYSFLPDTRTNVSTIVRGFSTQQYVFSLWKIDSCNRKKKKNVHPSWTRLPRSVDKLHSFARGLFSIARSLFASNHSCCDHWHMSSEIQSYWSEDNLLEYNERTLEKSTPQHFIIFRYSLCDTLLCRDKWYRTDFHGICSRLRASILLQVFTAVVSPLMTIRIYSIFPFIILGTQEFLSVFFSFSCI